MNKRVLSTVESIYSKSNAKNPIKTGNHLVDYVIGKNKYAKAWNVGFEVGKAVFVALQSFNELKRNKKY